MDSAQHKTHFPAFILGTMQAADLEACMSPNIGSPFSDHIICLDTTISF